MSATVLSVVGLIPELLPVIGLLDDVVVALALRYAGRLVLRACPLVDLAHRPPPP